MAVPEETHSTFIDELPFDIISTIFSFLHQRDVLTCMAVCRDWYERVPQYTKQLWKTLHITSRDVHTATYRRDRCLGNHVKSVVFQAVPEEQLYCTMRKLVELDCDVIETLEFVNCSTAHQDGFLGILRLLAPQLTHLKLRHHESNVAFLHLLGACPGLTHFTYQPSYQAWKEHDIYGQEPELDIQTPLLTDQFNSLIYLHMNTMLNLQLRLGPILERCPNLRYFIGACAESCSRRADSIRLDDLSRWCPKLAYFADNGSYHQLTTPKEEEDIMAFGKGKTTTTVCNYYNGSDKEQERTIAPIYHLAISEHHDGYHEQTIDYLLKYQNTLEYLKLVKFSSWYRQDIFSWSLTFQTLQMPRLHTLICDYVSYDMASLIILLNACPCIQEVDLSLVNQTLDQATLQQLHTLRHLRSLCLRGFSFDDELSVVALLERLPGLEKLVFESSSVAFTEPAYQYLTKLKHLELNKTKWERRTATTITGESSEIAATKVIFKPALFHYLALHGSRLSTLRLVRLQNVDMHEKDLLFSIANLPSLECLDIRAGSKPLLADNNDDELSSSALLAFVNELHQKSAATIGELRLRCVRRLHRAVLDKLQEFPRLRVLDIRFSRDASACISSSVLDTSGVLALLCKSRSLEIAIFGAAVGPDKSPGTHIKNMLREQNISRRYTVDVTGDSYIEDVKITLCHSKR